jgi:hypothetical protein
VRVLDVLYPRRPASQFIPRRADRNLLSRTIIHWVREVEIQLRTLEPKRPCVKIVSVFQTKLIVFAGRGQVGETGPVNDLFRGEVTFLLC